MICELCRKRRVQKALCPHRRSHCQTCCQFISDYIDTGKIVRKPVPMTTDVGLVMQKLGITQTRAIIILGGKP